MTIHLAASQDEAPRRVVDEAAKLGHQTLRDDGMFECCHCGATARIIHESDGHIVVDGSLLHVKCM